MINTHDKLSRFFISKKLGEVKGRALLRVDINVPVKDGKISRNNLRLKECAKSIEVYAHNGIIPIVLSHQGRIGDGDYLEGMEQHAQAIEALTKGVSVKYADSLTEDATRKAASRLKQGEALFLKNVRSHKDEKTEFGSIAQMANNGMVKSLSKVAEFYINDAPATMHRSDTSLVGFTHVMPSYLGLQMEKELNILNEIMAHLKEGKRTAIIFGGRKWEKFEYVYEISRHKNVKILSGGIPGESLCYVNNSSSFNKQNKKFISESGSLDTARKMVKNFSDRIIFPVEFVLDDRMNVGLDELKESNGMIMDIGDSTLNHFYDAITESEMIIYAGPVGVYEKGYNQTVRLITRFMGVKAMNYTFGGNSADSMDDIGLDRAYDLLSGKRITSGGSALAYLADKQLPVLGAFENKR